MHGIVDLSLVVLVPHPLLLYERPPLLTCAMD